MYQVEAIIDKKVDLSTKQNLYLVKWQNYDLSCASWEPFENLSKSCLDLVQQFEKQYGHMPTTHIGKIFIPNYRKKEQNIEINPSINKYQVVNGIKIIPKSQRKRLKNVRKIEESSQVEKVENDINLGIKQKQVMVQEVVIDSQDNKQQNPPNCKINNIYFKGPIVNPREETANVKLRQNSLALNWRGKINFRPIILKQPTRPYQRKQPQRKERRLLFSLVDRDYDEVPQQSSQKVKVVGMRIKGRQFQFYIVKKGKKAWVSHRYLYENHPKEMCRFYENNMIFE